MIKFAMISFLLSLITVFLYLPVSLSLKPDPSRIIPVNNPDNIFLTFGSSNSLKQNEQIQIFHRIAELKPDVWVWLGDVVYLDLHWFPAPLGVPGEYAYIERFRTAKRHPSYSQLLQATTVIGVWDDYDFGKKGGGKTYEHKNATQQMWLDFIDEPADSLRRTRNGIYESYYLNNSTQVKIILLDVRFLRDDQWSVTNRSKDILGEEQWQWLETELKENQAQYIVIGSGSQVFPDDRPLADSWYTESRERLVGLIKKHRVGGVLIISGDVLYAEMLKYPCDERVGYELHEFTSSGLAQSVLDKTPFVDTFISKVYPSTWNDKEDRHFEKNFGCLNFTFGEEGSVKFEARGEHGNVMLQRVIPYSSLKFDETKIKENVDCVLETGGFTRFFNQYKKMLFQGDLMFIVATLAFLGMNLLVLLLVFLFLRVIFGGVISVFRKKEETPKTKEE